MADDDSPSTPSFNTGALTKKIGPLPAYAWGIAVVLGIGLAIWWRNRNAEITGGAASGPGPDDISVGTGAGSAADIPGVTNPPPPSQPQIDDNETWSRFAGNWLVSQGHDPVGVSNALRKYISGEGGAPTPQERAWVNLALQKYGLPPGGAIGWEGGTIPKPTPTPTPTPKPTVMGPATRKWDANSTRVASARVPVTTGWEGAVKLYYNNVGTDGVRIARLAGNLKQFNAGQKGGYRYEVIKAGSGILVPQKINPGG